MIVRNNWFRLVLPKWVATIVAVLLVVTMTRNIQLNCAKEVMSNIYEIHIVLRSCR